jgi:hypothetical protein
MTVYPSAKKINGLNKRKASLADWYAAFPDTAQRTVRRIRADPQKKILQIKQRQRRIRAMKESLRSIRRQREYKRAKHISLAAIRAIVLKSVKTHKLTAADTKWFSTKNISSLFKAIGVTVKDRRVNYKGEFIANEPISDVQYRGLEIARNLQGW